LLLRELCDLLLQQPCQLQGRWTDCCWQLHKLAPPLCQS
jgi:hypothetical protein